MNIIENAKVYTIYRYTNMSITLKKPLKDKVLIVRLSNYENLTLKLESAKTNQPVSKLVRNKLFDYEN